MEYRISLGRLKGWHVGVNNTVVDVALSEEAEKTKFFNKKIGTEHNINLLREKKWWERRYRILTLQMGAQSSIYP